MPITVFGVPTQRPLSNKDLETCLEEVIEITKENWIIEEFYQEPTWRDTLIGRVPESLYSLYCGEQLINFYRSQGSSSLNTAVPAELAMAYLLGASNA
jgi:hypothetical protein